MILQRAQALDPNLVRKLNKRCQEGPTDEKRCEDLIAFAFESLTRSKEWQLAFENPNWQNASKMVGAWQAILTVSERN